MTGAALAPGAAVTGSMAGITVPDFTRMVVSSRRADGRVGGSVPCQPCVGAIGNVRCNLRIALGDGMRGGVSKVSFDDLGRKDARMVKEFNIP
jgi:hypothetical protein